MKYDIQSLKLCEDVNRGRELGKELVSILVLLVCGFEKVDSNVK